MKFIPPTPPIVLTEEEFSNLEVNLPLKIIFTPLLWDMDGTSKGPH